MKVIIFDIEFYFNFKNKIKFKKIKIQTVIIFFIKKINIKKVIDFYIYLQQKVLDLCRGINKQVHSPLKKYLQLTEQIVYLFLLIYIFIIL